MLYTGTAIRYASFLDNDVELGFPGDVSGDKIADIFFSTILKKVGYILYIRGAFQIKLHKPNKSYMFSPTKILFYNNGEKIPDIFFSMILKKVGCIHRCV